MLKFKESISDSNRRLISEKRHTRLGKGLMDYSG